MLNQIEAFLKTYLLIAAPAVFPTYAAGYKDTKTLATVAIAAILAPLLRTLNPKDAAYGIVKATSEQATKMAAKATKSAK